MPETKATKVNLTLVVSRILRDYTRGSFIRLIVIKDEDIVQLWHENAKNKYLYKVIGIDSFI